MQSGFARSSAASPSGAKEFGKGSASSPVCVERQSIARARQYGACLAALIYLQDIFWLVLSRGTASYFPAPYLVSPWQWPLFLLFIIHALAIAALCFAGTRLFKPMAEIPLGRRGIGFMVLAACLGNLFIFLIVAPGARYTEGGLTGTPGLVYGIFRGLSLGAMIFIVRMQALQARIPRALLFLFIVSYLLTIDGFSQGLALFIFVALIFPLRLRLSHLTLRWPAVAGAGFLIASVARQAKWTSYGPELNMEYLLSWLVPRFSIQSESMYSYLAGDLGIANSSDHFGLIVTAIRNRFFLLTGRGYLIEYPRSVSEAIYDGLFGMMGSGSSPGALLGTALFGPWLWVFPLILCFLFVQLFYHWRTRLTPLKAIGLLFLLKPLYADPSEYFTVVSPTLVFAVFFYLGCVFVPRGAGDPRRGGGAPPHWAQSPLHRKHAHRQGLVPPHRK